MRTNKLLIPFVLLVLAMFAASCNTGEGSGGTGSIEGTVYKVLHPDDNYNLQIDTVFAAKEDVFLVYGTQQFYGDDKEADHTGFYQFKYLRPGTYTVFTFSEDEDEIPSVVAKTISVPEPDRIYTFPDTFRVNVKP